MNNTQLVVVPSLSTDKNGLLKVWVSGIKAGAPDTGKLLSGTDGLQLISMMK